MGISEEQNRIELLLMHLLANDLDDKQREELLRWSKDDPKAIQLYCDFVRDYSLIKSQFASQISQSSFDSQFDKAIWETLIEDEKSAPALEISKEVPKRELIQKVVYPQRDKRKVSKFNIAFLTMNVAAILFFFLFLRFAPLKSNIEVATIIDQVDSRWTDSTLDFKEGQRLRSSEPFFLDKGIVKIQNDNGVVVLIEGPAKFSVERSGVYFEYGRIFSQVSESGLGFWIETPTSRYVDMGTEFGVYADVNGSTELHVMKGKVQLFAGSVGKHKTTQLVTENKAVCFDVSNGRVRNIPFQKADFVREMPSAYQRIVQEMSPLAYWLFEEGDAVRFDNSIANKPCEGQYIGDVEFEPGPVFVDGRAGKAVKLDGQDAFLLIPEVETISSECRDYSYAMWVRYDGVEDASDTERYCIFAGFGLYGHIALTKDGYLEYYSLSGYTPENFHRSSQKIQPGQWYHIAVTAKSYGTRRFYVNGVECGPAEPLVGLTQFCREISLGSVRQSEGGYNPQLYGKPFKGAISDLVMFSRELSSGEVKRLSDLRSNNQVLR